jgi:hypothetical protein
VNDVFRGVITNGSGIRRPDESLELETWILE